MDWILLDYNPINQINWLQLCALQLTIYRQNFISGAFSHTMDIRIVKDSTPCCKVECLMVIMHVFVEEQTVEAAVRVVTANDQTLASSTNRPLAYCSTEDWKIKPINVNWMQKIIFIWMKISPCINSVQRCKIY